MPNVERIGKNESSHLPVDSVDVLYILRHWRSCICVSHNGRGKEPARSLYVTGANLGWVRYRKWFRPQRWGISSCPAKKQVILLGAMSHGLGLWSRTPSVVVASWDSTPSPWSREATPMCRRSQAKSQLLWCVGRSGLDILLLLVCFFQDIFPQEFCQHQGIAWCVSGGAPRRLLGYMPSIHRYK